VFDAEAGVLSNPIYCVSKKQDNDLTIYTITCGRWGSEEFEVRQNKDYDNSSFEANFLGKHTYFIPITFSEGPRKDTYGEKRHRCRCKDLPPIGDDKTLTQWVLSHGIKEASFVCNPKDKAHFSLKAAALKQTRYQPRPLFAAKMARDLGMRASDVEFFLEEAAQKGESKFYLGEPGIEKFAAPINLVDREYFREDFDPEFNVGLDYPQAFALDTETTGPVPPEQRIGDAYDPGMGMTAEDGQSLSADVVLGAPPEQLEQMKSQAGVPNVFEHGLIGSLIHTYNSVAMIDKYIPDLEEALDRLGRLLFLYYWKPRDFEDAYGSDDMANLENQLLSTFQSFGELVLELLKKSESMKGSQGNVSMFSA
jgi:hypothetical protein